MVVVKINAQTPWQIAETAVASDVKN